LQNPSAMLQVPLTAPCKDLLQLSNVARALI
jgi:hypothetical protein